MTQTKLSFRPITIQDKELVERFTYTSCINICDFAFSNLFGWSDYYHTSIGQLEDTLLIRFHKEGYDHPLYLPILASSVDAFIYTLSQLINETKTNYYPLTLLCITDYVQDLIEKYFPKLFSFQINRNGCDYIYLREKLVTLSGKKLQSKRNHINKFEKLYPHYIVEDITTQNIEECLQLEKIWLQEHNQDESQIAEQAMIKKILINFSALDLKGILIRVDSEIIAFTLGSKINQNTFGIHVEKANLTYDGAFAIINREFTKRIPEEFIYINREEDMGIEGLRKAKLSYNPEELLCKKIAIMQHK